MSSYEGKPLNVSLHVNIKLSSKKSVNIYLGSFVFSRLLERHLQISRVDRRVQLTCKLWCIKHNLVRAKVINLNFLNFSSLQISRIHKRSPHNSKIDMRHSHKPVLMNNIEVIKELIPLMHRHIRLCPQLSIWHILNLVRKHSPSILKQSPTGRVDRVQGLVRGDLSLGTCQMGVSELEVSKGSGLIEEVLMADLDEGEEG